jgi:hypothetical protein
MFLSFWLWHLLSSSLAVTLIGSIAVSARADRLMRESQVLVLVLSSKNCSTRCS